MTTALADRLERGLSAPICLTWELTYACNLQCIHCLSSSGRRDPDELSTAEAQAVIDELEALGVFYINIGGGEPTLRGDFWRLVRYATEHRVGVKFSTNGSRIDAAAARQLAAADYLDVQVSVDGADAATNDAVRGSGSFATAVAAMEHLARAGFEGFKISVVVTRHNVDRLDELEALASHYRAQLRLTRLRPAGRGAQTWHELHPSAEQQRHLYHWLIERPEVLTGDSFFHLSALGEPLPGLNLCGGRPGGVPHRPAGRRVRVPVRDARRIQGRLGARRRRLHRGVALLGALRGAATALVGGRMRVLRPVRCLPGRLHGRQVLHRDPAGRPRPGVRERPRHRVGGDRGHRSRSEPRPLPQNAPSASWVAADAGAEGQAPSAGASDRTGGSRLDPGRWIVTQSEDGAGASRLVDGVCVEAQFGQDLPRVLVEQRGRHLEGGLGGREPWCWARLADPLGCFHAAPLGGPRERVTASAERILAAARREPLPLSPANGRQPCASK